jgi:general stress protein CsbA
MVLGIKFYNYLGAVLAIVCFALLLYTLYEQNWLALVDVVVLMVSLVVYNKLRGLSILI